MIQDEGTIKSHYRNNAVAQTYIDERFSKPLGRVQHQIQVETINRVIRMYNISNVLEVAAAQPD